MVQKAMEYIEKSPTEEKRVALIEALRTVTEGKIFLELESARLTRQLATIKEKAALDEDIEKSITTLIDEVIKDFI